MNSIRLLSFATSLALAIQLVIPSASFAEEGAGPDQAVEIAIPDSDDPYDFDESTGEIKICNIKDQPVIEIPGEIGGVPVRSVGESAFSENTVVEKVVVPDSVTHIGPKAFYMCTELRMVILPSSVEEIADDSFAAIPDDSLAVTRLGSYAHSYFSEKGLETSPPPSILIREDVTGRTIKSGKTAVTRVSVTVSGDFTQTVELLRYGKRTSPDKDGFLRHDGFYTIKATDIVGNESKVSFIIRNAPSSSYYDESKKSVRTGGMTYVNMAKYAPEIISDVVYYTDDNMLGKRLYSRDICILRKDLADDLVKINEKLRKQGLRLKIYDGYREPSVDYQFTMAVLRDIRSSSRPRLFPDVNMGNLNMYVATNTSHGYGIAIDCTAVDLKTGMEIRTPTVLDEFTRKASVANALKYADYSRFFSTMTKGSGYRIQSLPSEWWHFQYSMGERRNRPPINLRSLFYR